MEERAIKESAPNNDIVYIPVSYTHLDVYKRQMYDNEIYGRTI